MKDIKHIVTMIYQILSPKGRKLFIGVAAFSGVASFFDALSVSLLAPFIAIASDFEFIHSSETATKIYNYFGFQSDVEFVAALGLCVLAAYAIRSVMSYCNVYMISRFGISRYFYLSTNLFTNYLKHPLVDYTKRNVSDLTRTVMSETNQLTQMFSGLLTITTEILVLILLYSAMLYTDYKVTLTITVILGVFALILTKIISRIIKREGINRVQAGGRQFRALSSAFGNFRILKLQSSEEKSMSGYSAACSDAAISNTKIQSLQNVPRLGLELIGFGLMVTALTGYIYTQGTSIKPLIPVFALFALALYRLLPSLNRVILSYHQIISAFESLRVVHNELHLPKEELGNENVKFEKEIRVENINFCYEEKIPVLNNVSLNIQKGERVAFIGESGQGKSTLIDLIIGLIIPTSGQLCIDSIPLTKNNLRSWRKKIGYIPQTVYLFDASVADNVVFGREYDETLLCKVLQQANILEYLETKQGIHTMVGDAGAMLSGGQRQRIAIARALYGNPEVLVLDEATSGLDVETEGKILTELKQLNLDTTIITITHRRESIGKNQTVYEVKQGEIKLIQSSAYSDIA